MVLFVSVRLFLLWTLFGAILDGNGRHSSWKKEMKKKTITIEEDGTIIVRGDLTTEDKIAIGKMWFVEERDFGRQIIFYTGVKRDSSGHLEEID